MPRYCLQVEWFDPKFHEKKMTPGSMPICAWNVFLLHFSIRSDLRKKHCHQPEVVFPKDHPTNSAGAQLQRYGSLSSLLMDFHSALMSFSFRLYSSPVKLCPDIFSRWNTFQADSLRIFRVSACLMRPARWSSVSWLVKERFFKSPLDDFKIQRTLDSGPWYGKLLSVWCYIPLLNSALNSFVSKP